MRESIDHLAMLKRNLASIAGRKLLSGDCRIATGSAALDEALGGGLGRGRVHELFASSGDDAGSVTGFATMLALRAAGRQSPIFWLRTDEAERLGGRLHGPGLH
jgi:protein ImuA